MIEVRYLDHRFLHFRGKDTQTAVKCA